MSRLVTRLPNHLVRLPRYERKAWPIGSAEPMLPQNVSDRLINMGRWRGQTEVSNHRNSTEWASFQAVPGFRVVSKTWRQNGYIIYERETLRGGVLGTTCLGSLYYASGGWVIPPSYVLELCANSLAGMAVKAHSALLVSIAESTELARYISTKTSFLAKLAQFARDGNWRSAERLCRKEFGAREWNRRRKSHEQDVRDGSAVAANGHLEWTYAVVPTVNDVVQLADLYNGSLTKFGTLFQVLTVRGEYTKEYVGNSLITRAIETHRFTAKAVYAVDEPSLAALALLGLTDLPGSLWEATRWSFLVDWLVPVGDWCSSMTPTIGLNLVDSYVGAKVDELHEQGPQTHQGISYSMPPSTLTGCWRAKITPRAHLIVKNPFSLSHMVTTAALIRQLT